MTRSANITLTWGDGDHVFRLAIDQLVELEEKCDAGPRLILTRLGAGAWRVADIRETIRLGLVGGGKTAREALTLVERYVDAQRGDHQLADNVMTAEAVLSAALYGHEDEPPPKSAGEATDAAAGTSPTEKPAGPTSTAPAPPSA